VTKWNVNLNLVLGDVVSLESVGDIASEAPGPEQMAEMRETIARAMASLTDLERAVVLALAEGDSHAEIADRYCITLRAVRGIVSRVRKKAQEAVQ
jgi:DNA-directed RNA polymerase specialized sigma24 family protein